MAAHNTPPSVHAEDHMAEWMGIFHTFLAYRNPALAVADDDREEGPVEGLQAAILVSRGVTGRR